MRSLAALALGGILLSTVFAGMAAASCVEPNLPDQAARADVIAYGTVMRPTGLPFFPPAREVRFRVERVLKGIAPAEMDVAIGPGGTAATSVDYQVGDGAAHTLYLRRTGDTYGTDACSGSHPGAPTAEETTLLGGGTFGAAVDHRATNWALPVSIGALGLLAAAGVLIALRRRRVLEARGR